MTLATEPHRHDGYRGHWLGKLWAAPVSSVGILLGLLGLPFGARARLEHNALVFRHYPFGPGGALVLGNVVLSTLPSLEVGVPSYASRAGVEAIEWVDLAAHERAHTYQYELLGVFFLPLYLLAGGISAHNRFERAADRYATTGEGWWPFDGFRR